MLEKEKNTLISAKIVILLEKAYIIVKIMQKLSNGLIDINIDNKKA